MDGSGRWATSRHLPREEGHRAGSAAVRRTVEAARSLGVRWLTLFAFSSDNWQRPSREIEKLLELFAGYLREGIASWASQEIRVGVIGRRDRLGRELLRQIERAEAETGHGRGMRLRLAIDYSGREAILRAAARLQQSRVVLSHQAFTRALACLEPDDEVPPDVDLLIRTGGEQRLSDFLLWECAYAEILFTQRLWPDFDASDLEAALREFATRERRFGRIPEEALP